MADTDEAGEISGFDQLRVLFKEGTHCADCDGKDGCSCGKK